MTTFDWALTDILIVLLVLISLTLAMTVKKMRDLLRLDYRLHPTGVPNKVTRLVQAAESHYYSEHRASLAVEAVQDVLAIIAPQLVYRFNFSVGRMRMKPKTMETIMPWAIRHRMLSINAREVTELGYMLSYLAMIPNVCRWQAEVYLAKLRSEHPQLSSMDWTAIADDPALIAKLYSGYMGAGGDWQSWKASLEPGPEARRRFKYNASRQCYRLAEELNDPADR
jgi:hypothetical protein